MGKTRSLSRRKFLKSSVAAGVAAPAVLRAGPGVAANDRIRLGFIGVGNRGSQLLTACMGMPDFEIGAICDVYEPYRTRDFSKVDEGWARALGGRIPRMDEDLPDDVPRYKDFRRVLDQKDIDAVVIASPDHWHALQSILACDAGKDVYVEKPLSLTVREGRRMVEAARRHKRVVQVGLQRRSSKTYHKLKTLIDAGDIGKVTVARAYRISNMAPDGIGRAVASEPPPGFDWDLWLGPRPWRPFRENIAPYKFRWWQEYSSQMANWGVHYFDTIRWLLDEEAPVSISAHGGKFAVDDDRTVPDTAEVTFQFASGRLLVFGQYEASSGSAVDGGEIELRGTKGNVYCSQGSYRIEHARPGQFQNWMARDPLEGSPAVEGGRRDATALHLENFLECLRSRQSCQCDLETGHRSNTFALLANISLETGSRITWDPKKERILDPEEANDLLDVEYRAPWKHESIQAG